MTDKDGPALTGGHLPVDSAGRALGRSAGESLHVLHAATEPGEEAVDPPEGLAGEDEEYGEEAGEMVYGPGGLGRLAYAFTVVAMVAAAVCATVAINGLSEHKGAAPGVAMVWHVMMVVPTGSRIRNMGGNSLLGFSTMIPLYGLFMMGLCLISQERYFARRKLDLAGKFIAVFYVGLLILGLWLVVLDAMHPDGLG